MDPKTFPSNLDPKLKEAYDRVMSMSSPQSPSQAQTTPPPQTPTQAAPAQQPTSITTPFSVAQPAQPTGMAAGGATVNAPVAPVAAPSTPAANPSKHGSPLMSVVFIVCGVVF